MLKVQLEKLMGKTGKSCTKFDYLIYLPRNEYPYAYCTRKSKKQRGADKAIS